MTPERAFNAEILKSIKALGAEAQDHSFDNVGQVLIGAQRPADRDVHYRGTGFMLELKVVQRDTLPYSRIERHQVRALIGRQRTGCFGLVLVKHQISRRQALCWCIPASHLVARNIDLGTRGSFHLPEPGILQVALIPDPRGWTGRVWDLRTLFDNLIFEREMTA